MKLSAEEIVQKLASFPHRGTATEYEQPTLDFFAALLQDFNVKKEKFNTPKTYISIVWWLIGGIILGLILLKFIPYLGLIIIELNVVNAVRYFNWYSSLATRFVPQTVSNNVIIKPRDTTVNEKPNKIILMAHWDTAPISFLYRPEQVKNFRTSLNFSILLMIFTAIYALFVSFKFITFGWIGYGLLVYFLLQGILGTMDFFRLGYSNGASDNATGVAAAICTFQRLASQDFNVELVLTGAEEVGMIGAKAYFDKHKAEFNNQTYLINFDTLGNGKLKVITETGSLFNIKYENRLTQISQEIVAQNADFKGVTSGAWHTADFDSVWFQRAGIPSLTLAALDENDRMPNIHRPTDTLENVDFNPMNQAIQLATIISQKI